MIVSTQFLALVLALVEWAGAVQYKNITHGKLGNLPKGKRKQPTLDAPIKSENLKDGQRQTSSSYTYGSGYGYGGSSAGGYNNNYVAVGAEGQAEVAFKIDLSMFMQKMNLIPGLAQVVATLSQKIDMLVVQLNQGSLGNQGDAGLRAAIVTLEQSIIARLDQQDQKISALYQLIQASQGEISMLSQTINQVLAIVQSISSSGDRGGSSGRFCAKEMTVIENLVRQTMTSLAQVVEIVQTISTGLGKGSSRFILESIQQNFGLLQQLSTMVESISAQVRQGTTCQQVAPPGGSAVEVQIFETVRSIGTMIENIPGQVLVILQNSGLLGGSGGSSSSLTVYVQKLVEICGTIFKETIVVRDTLIGSRREIRHYFAESRRHLTAVKKVVTQSTEMVSTAAAAMQVAGRKLACPNVRDPVDLDE